MAKAVEDTAFYRYVRLLSLNEVGGDPRRFGTAPATFHRRNAMRARTTFRIRCLRPRRTITSAAKTRACASTYFRRCPGVGVKRYAHSRGITKERALVESMHAPTHRDEYAIYQTLVGTWPADWLQSDERPPEAEIENYVERLGEWCRKAMREAKLQTSWTHPNAPYEEATLAFISRLFEGPASQVFQREMQRLVRDVASARHDHRPLASRAQTHLARRSGYLSRMRAVGSLDGRSGQPAQRRFRLAVTAARRYRPRCGFTGPRPLLERACSERGPTAASKCSSPGACFSSANVTTRRFRTVRIVRSAPAAAAANHSSPLHATTSSSSHRGLCIQSSNAPTRACHYLDWTNEYVALTAKFPRRYMNVFTNAEIRFDNERRPRLDVTAILKDFPVAVLVPA